MIESRDQSMDQSMDQARDDRPSPALVDALAQAHLQPLWDRYMRQLTKEPIAPDSPMAWSWRAMQPLIARAVAEVPMEHAERRVLLFSHPAFTPRATTTTNLASGLQILQPGEQAGAHRHAAAALRFMLQGKGAVTWVNGQRCDMAEGDLILTPAWCWHEHRNEGNERVVWFDGLDVPLVQHLSSAFLEFAPPSGVPAPLEKLGLLPDEKTAGTAPPVYRFESAATRAALVAMTPSPDGSCLMRYRHPISGGPVMPTLDCYALSLAKAASTRAYRSTYNAVAVVAQGSGQSKIGSQLIEWEKGDVFSMPHWHWVSHCAHEAGSQLFLMTDYAVIDSLGYLRTEFET
jgi:gentisate 1,2-dioxygenase